MTAMARKSRIGSALLMSGLLGAALAVGVPAPPAGATDGQPTAPEPSWGSCERFLGQDSDVLPDARCATLSVPVDYANPTGPQAQLALIKIPATGKRIGALLVNPGGPGASAVDALAALGVGLAGSPITEHFDLVAFDPRGVGHSCEGRTPSSNAARRVSSHAAGIAPRSST